MILGFDYFINKISFVVGMIFLKYELLHDKKWLSDLLK